MTDTLVAKKRINIKQYASAIFSKVNLKTRSPTNNTLPNIDEKRHKTASSRNDNEIPISYYSTYYHPWSPIIEYSEPYQELMGRKNSIISVKSIGSKLNRITSIRSSSSSFSTASSSNSSLKNYASALVRSKSRKKESKAIEKWRFIVQELTCNNDSKLCNNRTDKDEALSRFILHEFYSTEKSFYLFLLFIQKNYMEPMIRASQTKNGLVKLNDAFLLFHCLSEFIALSEKLVHKLENAVQEKLCPGHTIGCIFREMESEFTVYLKYAIHYQDNFKSIRKASKHSFIVKIEAFKHEHYRLGLSDYLIAPFQRIPRYELLLKDLMKHTNQSKEDLVYAKNVIHGLAFTMNHIQERNTMFSSYSFP